MNLVESSARRNSFRILPLSARGAFFCREPSSCLAVLEWEGKEVWRYLCEICYDLLEKEDFESLEKRLREKGIIRCMMYRPLSDGGKKEGAYIFRQRSEL